MPRVSLPALLLGTLLLSSYLLAWPGKPPKGDPPPESPPAPIAFEYVEFTLGGPSRRGFAYGVNEHGEVVGDANVAEGVQHAFVYTDRYSSDGSFVTHDLNDLLLQYVGNTDWLLVSAYSINKNGWILGDGSTPGEQYVPFYFIPPTFDAEGSVTANARIFRVTPAGLQGFAWGLTDDGDAVVDTFVDSPGNGRGVAVYDSILGQTVDTGITGSVPVAAMNNAAQVVGATGGFGTGLPFQAYIYDYPTDTFTPLPLLGISEGGCDIESRAMGINSAGLVVGWSTTASIPINKKQVACGPIHAFAWTAENGIADLGTLGGSVSRAFAVSDANEITGTTTDASGAAHMFLYSAELNGMVSVTGGIVNPPADSSLFVPSAMNSSRVIVGTVSQERVPFMLVPVN